MTAIEKINLIQELNKSKLCVGLDTDIEKIPNHFPKEINSITAFNKQIIDSTADLVSAYKLNFAFYEQYGIEGIRALKETFDYIPKNIFTIADAKRGDIGNTSQAYAKSCFGFFNADSVTVNPYMGIDSVMPFIEYKDKMVFLLALTSNKGSSDLQRLVSNGKPIYQHVVEKSKEWSNTNNIGYVVGATHPDELKQLRKIAPGNYFLIPGIGTQGGDIQLTMSANSGCPAIVNVSRSVIYSSSALDFAERAREKALYFKEALI